MRTKFRLLERSLNFGRKSSQRNQWEVNGYAVNGGDANSLVGSPPGQGRYMVRPLAWWNIEANRLSTDENRALARAVQTERYSHLHRPSRNPVLVSTPVADDQMRFRTAMEHPADHASDLIGALRQ
jgi:hypothetical protein